MNAEEIREETNRRLRELDEQVFCPFATALNRRLDEAEAQGPVHASLEKQARYRLAVVTALAFGDEVPPVLIPDLTAQARNDYLKCKEYVETMQKLEEFMRSVGLEVK